MIEFQNRQIKLVDGSRVVICRILGSIDGSSLMQFEEKLQDFLNEGIKYLILVFSQVKYINSSGMGILVKLADQFNAIKGEMHLVDVPEKLIALFSMLGLLSLIKVSKSEEEALRFFQSSGAAAPKKDVPPADFAKKPVVKNPTQTDNARPKSTASSNIASGAPASAGQAKAPQPPKGSPPQSQHAQPKAPQGKPQQTSAPASKIFIVNCQKCQSKISLGAQLRAGAYRCPKCKAVFKILESGKISFMPS
jgi:anti-anti-sigma factor